VACCVIVVTCLIALFAYPLAPDGTPAANDMMVELSARPAGYQQQVLLVPRHQTDRPSTLQQIFNGSPARFHAVPINGFFWREDRLYARHYIDEGIEDTLTYTLGDLAARTQADVAKDQIKTRYFFLGTDRYGRDILSRLLVGARVSIVVGLVSVLLSLSIGILMGAAAGWYGGWVDDLVMWLINILWSIPTLLLVFAITLTIGKGFWEIFIAIGLTSWVSAARLIRGQVMQLKEMDYITAAKALGFNNRRIIVKHILPNIAGPIMVIAAANFATAILTEAGLSFLGIGVQPPTPSWGLMIKEHYNFLIAGNPLPALIPGLAIMILVLAFNIVGNALRDAIDVRA
jgi:ABC-type dipeptide/oligopeptide/nickel transport system permease subunit